MNALLLAMALVTQDGSPPMAWYLPDPPQVVMATKPKVPVVKVAPAAPVVSLPPANPSLPTYYDAYGRAFQYPAQSAPMVTWGVVPARTYQMAPRVQPFRFFQSRRASRTVCTSQGCYTVP